MGAAIRTPHLFGPGQREVFCGQPTTAEDTSTKEYEALEAAARSGPYTSSLRADVALGQICKLCVKLYESTKP